MTVHSPSINPLVRFVRNHPILTSVFAVAVGMGCIWFIPTGSDIYGMIPVRLVLAALMLAIMAIAGGTAAIKPSCKGLGYEMTWGLYMLAFAFGLGMVAFLLMPLTGAQAVTDWPLQLLALILLCLCVGVFEEGLFRGILLNGLLAKIGGTKRGIVTAILVSALLFGFAHVAPSFLVGDVYNPATAGQAILKTLQGAFMGFLFAVLYLRSHNFWGIVALHGLNDFFVLIQSAVFTTSLEFQYVSSTPDSAEEAAQLFAMLFAVVMYAPLLAIGILQIRKVHGSDFGIFVEEWNPRSVAILNDPKLTCAQAYASACPQPQCFQPNSQPYPQPYSQPYPQPYPAQYPQTYAQQYPQTNMQPYPQPYAQPCPQQYPQQNPHPSQYPSQGPCPPIQSQEIQTSQASPHGTQNAGWNNSDQPGPHGR